MNTTDQEYLLNNKFGGVPFLTQLGTMLNKTGNLARVTYDFAVDGGAVSTITPAKTVILPNKAIVTNAFVNVLTTCTSGGSATVAINSEGAGDILAATAVASLTAGLIQGVPDWATIADYKKMTADRTVKVTIATAALTAGKMEVFIYYVLGQ